MLLQSLSTGMGRSLIGPNAGADNTHHHRVREHGQQSCNLSTSSVQWKPVSRQKRSRCMRTNVSLWAGLTHSMITTTARKKWAHARVAGKLNDLGSLPLPLSPKAE